MGEQRQARGLTAPLENHSGSAWDCFFLQFLPEASLLERGVSPGLAFLQILCEVILSKFLFFPNFQLPNPFFLFFLFFYQDFCTQAWPPRGCGAGRLVRKVLVAALGLSEIPIKLDFVEVGNSSSV